MSLNNKTRYRAIERFAMLAREALPTGMSVVASRDRRGRVVLECMFPRVGNAADRKAVRIVLLAETFSSYMTAPHMHRINAQARFILWVRDRVELMVTIVAGRLLEEWVMGPTLMFPED